MEKHGSCSGNIVIVSFSLNSFDFIFSWVSYHYSVAMYSCRIQNVFKAAIIQSLYQQWMRGHSYWWSHRELSSKLSALFSFIWVSFSSLYWFGSYFQGESSYKWGEWTFDLYLLGAQKHDSRWMIILLCVWGMCKKETVC